MYLKQVELQGFKSFAGKSTFEFHNGITCIVGPNGSGKSNIADAVRWVLGEQSAKALRGHNMQDVIFAGTQTRRPVSYASVCLLLDNSDGVLPIDFSEVKVTRRVYRSGESEYLINGSACRLRDIQELFYDTGVGKEGYSLIGQGQIEKILNGKPQERRELFDEAAGIVKFKRRKAAAQKKLDAEQENLIRINDIITELERQVGPLKRQSEKARIYLQKKEALKDADVKLFALQAVSMQTQKAGYEENLSHLEEELSRARASYEKQKAESGRIEAQQKVQEEKIDSLRSLQNEKLLQKNALEHQIELLAAQGRADDLSRAHYAGRLSDLEVSISQKADARSQYGEKQEEIRRTISGTQAQRRRTDDQIAQINESIRLFQERIDQINAQVLSLMEEKTEAQSVSRHYDTLLQENEARKKQLEEEANTASSLYAQYEEASKHHETARKEARESLYAFRADLKKTQEELSALTDERNTLRDRQEEIRRSLSRALSQLETIRNMAERYEGYGQSIRKVMQRHHPGVIGVVADLLQTDQRYETAIETALGAGIQNIVTRDAQSAREMIDYLKKERLGRATFLPLTDVTPKRSAQEKKALGEAGVIGTADTLVTYEPQYQGIASSLLGSILVVDTIDHAILIERKYAHSLRIVTLEGEFLRPGGSMTGGAFRGSSNLLGRKREQEALSERAAQYQKMQQEVSDRLDEITQQRASCRERTDALQDEITKAELAENTALMDLKRLSDEAAAQENRLSEIRVELSALGERMADSGAQHEDSAEQIRRIDRQREELEAENAKTAERFQEAMHERTRLSEQAQEQTLFLQSLEQNLTFQQENIDRITEEEKALREEADQIRGTQQKAAERAQTAGDQEKELRSKIEEAQKEAQQAAFDLSEALSQKEELNRSYRAFFEAREEMTRDIARLEKEQLRLNESVSRIAETLEKRDTYIWEEYGLTRREAILAGKDAAESESALKKLTKEISAEIRDLGHVNVNAIEEYKEVGKRYEQMTTQRDDIEEAAGNLRQMIGSLDTGMKKQFREQFARIQAEFQKVFAELFGGGHGTIELVQGEDDLETGIEIIAQPPGKKLQNMMQLSGGEKALTAICLLFAIQNLKPSAFCILDEIEAALDEPNVDRFANYLKKLSGRTQFIVITHRRGSMAAADRLYGITMQEKGVSAQVSVELAEKEMVEEEKEAD